MSPSFAQIQLSPSKEIGSALLPLDVHEIGTNGYLLQFKNSSIIARLDADLEEIWRKDFGNYIPATGRYKLAIGQDGLLVGLIYNHEFKIIDLNGSPLYELKLNGSSPYQEADCYFSDDNKLILHLMGMNLLLLLIMMKVLKFFPSPPSGRLHQLNRKLFLMEEGSIPQKRMKIA